MTVGQAIRSFQFFRVNEKNWMHLKGELMCPSYKTAFGSFLKQEDLQGKAVKVLIAGVEMEEVKNPDSGKNEMKLVMHFAGKDKALILNRTNCEAMEAICGTDDYGAWVGHPIILFTDPTVKFGGKTVGGLRLRAINGPAVVVPPPPPPVVAEDFDDETIPF